jgi:hypothetical protein
MGKVPGLAMSPLALGFKLSVKLVVGVLVLVLSVWPAAADTHWQIFQPPGCVCSVEFPGTPIEQKMTIKNTLGEQIPVAQYALTVSRTAAVMISIGDYSAAGAPGIGQSVINTVVTNIRRGRPLESDGTRTVDGHLGRRVEFTQRDGTHVTLIVFYFKRRVYQLMMINIGDAGEPKAVFERFEQSLRFE